MKKRVIRMKDDKILFYIYFLNVISSTHDYFQQYEAKISTHLYNNITPSCLIDKAIIR